MANEYDMSDIEARRLEEKRAKYNSRYLIGTPVFSKIREGNYFYIDKTEYVYNMTHSGAEYVFLSRPRRFGKSLLVSTLQCYFEGRKELFKGLAIDKLETEWEQYPVLHFDLSTTRLMTEEELLSELSLKLSKYERIYGRSSDEIMPGQRLQGLIERAHEKSKKDVVVLIDEYDTPMLEVVHDEDRLGRIRDIMQKFYSPLKACGDYLKFVFITGITKFSQMSIFSALNNIRNISMLTDYAAVCGITEEELITQMPEEVDKLAAKQGMTREEALREIKIMYDGYHFCWPSPDIYNPFSLMNALDLKNIDSYWFETGTPTYLIDMLRKFDTSPDKVVGRFSSAEKFYTTLEQINVMSLMYMVGYLSITDYDEDDDVCLIDYPNNEVQSATKFLAQQLC